MMDRHNSVAASAGSKKLAGSAAVQVGRILKEAGKLAPDLIPSDNEVKDAFESFLKAPPAVKTEEWKEANAKETKRFFAAKKATVKATSESNKVKKQASSNKESSQPHTTPSSFSSSPTSDLPAPMSLFLATFNRSPSSHMFVDIVSALDSCYVYVPVPFLNGRVMNAAGENAASAKLLSFAKISGLSDGLVAQLWGEHYRGVVKTPALDDHANIRSFLAHGMAGVAFPEGLALKRKKGV